MTEPDEGVKRYQALATQIQQKLAEDEQERARLRDELGRYQTADPAQQQVAQPLPQWTDADVAAATSDQLTAAIEAGQCRDVGMPPPRRSGHWHDNDQPPVSPLAQLVARQQAESAASEKARTAPATLTDDDIGLLDHRQVSELVASGGLAHLGIGATRHG